MHGNSLGLPLCSLTSHSTDASRGECKAYAVRVTMGEPWLPLRLSFALTLVTSVESTNNRRRHRKSMANARRRSGFPLGEQKGDIPLKHDHPLRRGGRCLRFCTHGHGLAAAWHSLRQSSPIPGVSFEKKQGTFSKPPFRNPPSPCSVNTSLAAIRQEAKHLAEVSQK